MSRPAAAAALTLLWAPACVDTSPDPAKGSGDAADDGGADTAAGPTVDRGPTTLEIDGDPNGLWWDGALVIADDDNNRLLRWSDADGLGLIGELGRAPAQGAGLGQPVRTADGAVVVPRFGFGTAGEVATLSADGETGFVPGLDRERRRIGLGQGPDGALYTSWYLSDAGNRAGAVSLLDLSGGEDTLVSGFVKPVGVIVLDGALIVSDQLDNLIVRCPLDDPEDKQIFVRVDGPDLLAAGPDGGVFTGGPGGELRLAFPDDTFEVVQGGFQEVRGVAYDPDNRRVFVVDHDGDDSDGTVNFLHILPVDR
jgi:hypothetical protein